MLSSDTIERKRGWAEILDLDHEAVRICINFIYSGKASLSLENPEYLIQASDLMQIPRLTEMYFEFLAENVTVETCLLYIKLASKYHAEVISDRLRGYMVCNIEKIFISERLSKIDEQQLCEELDLLPTNLPNRKIRKWRAIETWVKADMENRNEKFHKLFKVLLLDKIPLEYLTKEILLSDLVKSSEECRDAIMSSFSSENQRLLMQDVHGPLTAADHDPLPPFNKKPTHVVARNGNSPWLHIMDLATYKWSRYTRLPLHLRGLRMVGLMDGVYTRTKDGDIVRYSDGNWEKICTLDGEMRKCQWLGFGDCIWFIEHNCIRKYNPVTNIWAKLPVNPTGFKSVSTCAVSKDRIMLMGVNENTGRELVKEFDFKFNEWDDKPVNPAAISGACFARKSCITWQTWDYKLKKYDPNTDEWVTMQMMLGQENLTGMKQVIASDSYVYLFGKGKGALCNCDSFKISKLFSIPTKFSNFCLI